MPRGSQNIATYRHIPDGAKTALQGFWQEQRGVLLATTDADSKTGKQHFDLERLTEKLLALLDSVCKDELIRKQAKAKKNGTPIPNDYTSPYKAENFTTETTGVHHTTKTIYTGFCREYYQHLVIYINAHIAFAQAVAAGGGRESLEPLHTAIQTARSQLKTTSDALEKEARTNIMEGSKDYRAATMCALIVLLGVVIMTIGILALLPVPPPFVVGLLAAMAGIQGTVPPAALNAIGALWTAVGALLLGAGLIGTITWGCRHGTSAKAMGVIKSVKSGMKSTERDTARLWKRVSKGAGASTVPSTTPEQGSP
ncbi:MAG TPA: hypothetical protein VNC84_05555 [Gammaproteobacteria bacterium]|jgi:hypothetical protein|nr:hypothetical protein [Gammaproteobacteria bacterium]